MVISAYNFRTHLAEVLKQFTAFVESALDGRSTGSIYVTVHCNGATEETIRVQELADRWVELRSKGTNLTAEQRSNAVTELIEFQEFLNNQQGE